DALGKIQSNYVDRVGLPELYRQGLAEFGFALSDPMFRRWHMRDASDDEVRAFHSRLRDSWGEPNLRDSAAVRQTVKEIALEAQKALGVRPSFVVMEFICGACNALDERSAFLPPSEEYTTHLGQLNSLGMLVASTADNPPALFVEKVALGSWAAQVG